MLLGKECRTIWGFLSPTESRDWLLSSWRILSTSTLVGGKTTQVNIKANKTNPAHTKGRASSTKCLHPPVQTSAPQAAFLSLTFVLETSLQHLHAALQMLEWHLDSACMIYLPVSLSFPGSLPNSSRSIWASPSRASNNIYQLQFFPFSNIPSDRHASFRPVHL